MINLGGWALALILTLAVPNYWAALAIFLFIFVAEMGYYLLWRNQTVGLKDLSGEIKKGFSGLGKKKEKEVKATEGAVVLVDKGGKAFPPPVDEDPYRPVFDALQSLLQGPLKLRANRIDLRPVEGGSVQRYNVDGVTFEGKSFPREISGEMVGLVKSLAGMDVNDRRKPQTGQMKINTDQGRHEIEVYTAGSTAGEMMRLLVDRKKQFEFTVENLGFLQDQYETMQNIIADPGGVVILTAPEGQGLTNLCYGVIRKHDAFLSHIQTLERDPQADIEGIRHNTIAASAPSGEEQKQVEWLVSQEPDVIYIDRIDDPRTAIDLARYAKEGSMAQARR
jgi:type II secretory ATPase GspE/PulE/Tfp pilus assembly ATPase PilB-like protein